MIAFSHLHAHANLLLWRPSLDTSPTVLPTCFTQPVQVSSQ